MLKPHFFATPVEWRAWLEEHHAEATELWVGLYKRDSGRLSITWPEVVDGALCFGWIDGVRKSIDYISYKIRFTPRKPRSVWSTVNVKRVAELSKAGLMHSAGLAEFQKRDEKRSRLYSYEERETAKLPAAFEKEFRAHAVAWNFFQGQAPWYRKTSSFWVISAKKEETRLKRLAVLIEDSASQRTIKALTRAPRK